MRRQGFGAAQAFVRGQLLGRSFESRRAKLVLEANALLALDVVTFGPEGSVLAGGLGAIPASEDVPRTINDAGYGH